MNSRLQLALDDITLEDALHLLEQIQDDVDIVEIGTPFMMEYGILPIKEIRKHFPQMEVLLDAKIMDAGFYEAEVGLKEGADYVTVLAVTDDRTIAEVAQAAAARGKKSVADMICVTDFQTRVPQLEALGVDILAVHTGIDQQAEGRTPLDDLREIRKYVNAAAVAVAGGISPETIDAYLEYEPEIIIVGGGIVHASDPAAAAKELKRKMREYSFRQRQQ